jgi:ubiquinone biosynthesis monooxygenase Coq7
LSLLDTLLIEADRALRTLAAPALGTGRPNPAANATREELSDADRRHAAGLMRINHAGEICAQALYFGHARVARDGDVRAKLLRAADEEGDHLAWCRERLGQLRARPSLFDPLWYAGAFGLGVVAGLGSDRWNLGFVVETERQVEAHLGDHLQQLPAADHASRAIVSVMQHDEAAHAEMAQQAGASALPWPIPSMMRRAAGVMKAVAYHV